MSDSRDGKRAVRNWANLPPEVLRLVVTNYLAYKPHASVPASWLHTDFHYQRSVFETLRDAYDVERIMRVCPQWHNSLLNMDFWVAACRKFDRADIFNRPMLMQRDPILLQQSHPQQQQQSVGLTRTLFRKNFHYFRTLTRTCCLPCRINRPLGRDGIGNVKGSITTAHFGQVPVCKHHRVNYFCGVCLKDVSLASEGDHAQYAKVPESLFENEDFDTWPSVHTTCFHCRREALLRTVVHYSNTTSIDLYNFIGGPTLAAKDYEARSTVENFVDMAEGGVNDVINVLLERHWLRINTNLGSLLDQAVASARYTRAEIDDYESEDDMLSDDEEDSYDMLQSQEENGIRLLAVSAWARSRIMDGNWDTPTDLWTIGTGQLDSSWDPSVLPPTLHPISYCQPTSPSSQLSRSIGMSQKDDSEDASMLSSTTEESVAIHYPAADRFMSLPSERFVQLANTCFRNTLRDILFEPLRRLVYQTAWEAQEAKQDPCVRLSKIVLDDILAMLRDEKVWYVVSSNRGNARLPHHIPYIPVSTENMAPATKNLLMSLWREACAPLYQCRCSICDRALQRQAQEQGQQRSSVQQDGPALVELSTMQPPITLHPAKLPEENILLEEEEEKTEEVENEEEEDAAMNVDVDVDLNTNTTTTLTPPETGSGFNSDTESSRSRKRSSASVDEDGDDGRINDKPLRPGISIVNGSSTATHLPRKKQRTLSPEDVEAEAEEDDDDIDSVPRKSREVPIVVSSISPEELRDEGVHPTSSSPASSVFSSLSTSESASSSPSSVSSDSSSLRTVSSNSILLPGQVVTHIKPGVEVGVRVAIGPGACGALSDTVKIRGKDDPAGLPYEDETAQESMERYYA